MDQNEGVKKGGGSSACFWEALFVWLKLGQRHRWERRKQKSSTDCFSKIKQLNVERWEQSPHRRTRTQGTQEAKRNKKNIYAKGKKRGGGRRKGDKKIVMTIYSASQCKKWE